MLYSTLSCKNTQIEEAPAAGLKTDNSLCYRKKGGEQSLVETSKEKIKKIFKEINRNGFNDVTLQHINELYNEIENG